MTWRLPPLSSLRAFEAAARHLSFADAAAELFVTPGAISRQIKTLEDYFGVPVFKRQHRKVELTPDGVAYAAVVKQAFERLQIGTTRMISGSDAKSLHIVCPLTFAGRWLVPRMSSFIGMAPDISINLTTGASLRNLNAVSNADVAIEFWRDNEVRPDFESHLLVRCKLAPVTSPAIARQITTPGDLRTQRLLHSTLRPHAWPQWAKGAGVEVDANSGMKFSSLALAYEAAADGVGVAMGDLALIVDDLASGRLACPLGPVVNSGDYYALVYPSELKADTRIARFRDWLIAEAQKEETAARWSKHIEHLAQ